MTDYFSGGALKQTKSVIESACFGLTTYEEEMTNEQWQRYEIEEEKRRDKWKARRKAGYRKAYYDSLTEEEVKQMSIDKTQKLLNDLRRKWFTAKCSGQCMDFNCVRCEALRMPLKRELDAKQQELTNLEEARMMQR